MDELRRDGVLGEDRALLDEVDLEAQLVEGHPVPQVAVEAVRLLDEDGAAVGVLYEMCEHRLEARPPCPAGRLDIDELGRDGEPVRFRVGSQKMLPERVNDSETARRRI